MARSSWSHSERSVIMPGAYRGRHAIRGRHAGTPRVSYRAALAGRPGRENRKTNPAPCDRLRSRSLVVPRASLRPKPPCGQSLLAGKASLRASLSPYHPCRETSPVLYHARRAQRQKGRTHRSDPPAPAESVAVMARCSAGCRRGRPSAARCRGSGRRSSAEPSSGCRRTPSAALNSGCQ